MLRCSSMPTDCLLLMCREALTVKLWACIDFNFLFFLQKMNIAIPKFGWLSCITADVFSGVSLSDVSSLAALDWLTACADIVNHSKRSSFYPAGTGSWTTVSSPLVVIRQVWSSHNVQILKEIFVQRWQPAPSEQRFPLWLSQRSTAAVERAFCVFLSL